MQQHYGLLVGLGDDRVQLKFAPIRKCTSEAALVLTMGPSQEWIHLGGEALTAAAA